MSKLLIDSSSDIILIKTILEGPLNSHLITFVIDTGASMTTIPYEVAVKIGIDPAKSPERVTLITASAREYAPVITIPKMRILRYTLTNVKAVCLDLPPSNSNVDGLLGLNALKSFNISLKFKAGFVEITKP